MQTMLWFTPGNLRAASPTGSLNVLPGSYGDQGANALDDNAPPDGTFNPLTECVSYGISPEFCGNSFGKMVAFGGSTRRTLMGTGSRLVTITTRWWCG